MFIRWPFGDASPKLVVNEGVARDVFGPTTQTNAAHQSPARLRELAAAQCHRQALRRIGAELLRHEGIPVGSFSEPALRPEGRVLIQDTVGVRYVRRRNGVRRWLLFRQSEPIIEIIDVFVIPFLPGS